MKWNCRIRCALVCLGFTALFSAFSFRLVYLQMIKHDEYSALAADKHGYKQKIFAERGTIVDVNNEKLAHNVPGKTVVADATRVNDVAKLVPLLAEGLDLPAAELAEKLSGNRRYVVLKRAVATATAEALERQLQAEKLRGIYFDPESTRVYPNNSMLCHVIGFTNFEHQGIQGVELSMDEYLRGENGYRYIERNVTGREIVSYRGQERRPA